MTTKNKLRLLFAGLVSLFFTLQGAATQAPAEPQDAATRAKTAFDAGVSAANRNDLAAAGALFDQALAAARETGDRRMEARALNAQGNIALRKNDLATAWDRYTAAVVAGTETGHRLVLMLSERGLGDVAAARGQNFDALKHFETSLALAREEGNDRIAEGVLNAIGSVYLELADYGKALEYFQAALKTPTDSQDEVSYTLNNLGYAYSDLGYSEIGLSYFHRALAIAEKLHDDYAVMRLHNNIGLHYAKKGDNKRALDHFTRALHLAQGTGDHASEAHDWNSLGSIYEAQKRYALAADAYGKSLALARGAGALDEVSQALYNLAGIHLARREYPQAIERAGEAGRTAAETGSRESFWKARTIAGKAFHALGQDAAARTAFGEAIALVEEERTAAPGGELGRETFFGSRLEPYQRLVELAADRGEAAEALAHAERAKARSLLDVLRSGRVDLSAQLTPEERAAEAKLREALRAVNGEVFLARSQPADPGALAALEGRQQQARLELETFTTNLYATRPALRTQRLELPDWTLETARALLKTGDTALLEYAVQEASTLLFVVTADGASSSTPTVHLYRLAIGRAELTRRVEAFRRQLAQRDLRFRAPARSLYTLLLAPAAADLRGKRALGIVPDGALWDLPFQALQPGATEALLERHAVFYAPSLSFLAEVTARRPGKPGTEGAEPPTLLAVANPALGPAVRSRASVLRSAGRLGPLPDAEREVRSLVQLYGAEHSKVYTAAQASEKAVKAEAGKYRVLHFATHALLDDRNPLYSSLVLSQQSREGEDGLLEAWEVLGLHLDADLVVLSACETARGQPQAGEGMIGMSWALAAAGSPATLASQWEVDSASTSKLMTGFHRGWREGLGKAEALRQAALAVRRQERYRHPFYWAAFVLVGRGD
ncbi:MAG TPA: CHAT domain-containing protein [Thermoanaerobaculia bacterium]|nr:CHAT domain-containing protein [Thermoanaerobaculia bacterium]